MDTITQALRAHYAGTFDRHGATSRGVDWGAPQDVEIRYSRMLDVIQEDGSRPVSLLDVGCGYGGLYQYAQSRGISLRYTGIDVADNMIAHATQAFPDARFICADVFEFEPDAPFDYVVCNGILTQKLSTSIKEMDRYCQRLIKRLFDCCGTGVAFNVMTTKVNFMAENLYYRNPVELLAYCMSEVTDKVRLDHAYPLYEYTMYLYKA